MTIYTFNLVTYVTLRRSSVKTIYSAFSENNSVSDYMGLKTKVLQNIFLNLIVAYYAYYFKIWEKSFYSLQTFYRK